VWGTGTPKDRDEVKLFILGENFPDLTRLNIHNNISSNIPYVKRGSQVGDPITWDS
jgi:hypothetical protein